MCHTIGAPQCNTNEKDMGVNSTKPDITVP